VHDRLEIEDDARCLVGNIIPGGAGGGALLEVGVFAIARHMHGRCNEQIRRFSPMVEHGNNK
jgi:hypothetical protein